MLKLTPMLVLLACVLTGPAAWAYELTDNPAFCAGFLATQSDRDASMMRTHESKIMRAFNRFGPKDSTDGRGYNEWLHEGVNAARDTSNRDAEAIKARCRALIERIAQ